MYKNIEKQVSLKLKDLVDYQKGQVDAGAKRASQYDDFFI